MRNVLTTSSVLCCTVPAICCLFSLHVHLSPDKPSGWHVTMVSKASRRNVCDTCVLYLLRCVCSFVRSQPCPRLLWRSLQTCWVTLCVSRTRSSWSPWLLWIPPWGAWTPSTWRRSEAPSPSLSLSRSRSLEVWGLASSTFFSELALPSGVAGLPCLVHHSLTLLSCD